MSTRNECHLPALFLPLSQQEDTDTKRNLAVSFPHFIQKQMDKKRQKHEFDNTFDAFDRARRSIRDHFSKAPWEMVNDAFAKGKQDERYAKFYHKYETEMDINVFMQLCDVPYALFENSANFKKDVLKTRKSATVRSVGYYDLFWGMGDHVLPQHVFETTIPEEHVETFRFSHLDGKWQRNWEMYGKNLRAENANDGGRNPGAPFWLYVTREGSDEAGSRRYFVRGFGGATRAYGLKYKMPPRMFTKVKVVIFVDQKNKAYDLEGTYTLFDTSEARYNAQIARERGDELLQGKLSSPDYWDLHPGEHIVQYFHRKNFMDQMNAQLYVWGVVPMLALWGARVGSINKETNPAQIELKPVWTSENGVRHNIGLEQTLRNEQFRSLYA